MKIIIILYLYIIFNNNLIMSGYIVCPTCGRVLADKYLPYEEGLLEINEKKISQEEKEKEIIKLMDSLDIPRERYCCRMRIATQIDLYRVIK